MIRPYNSGVRVCFFYCLVINFPRFIIILAAANLYRCAFVNRNILKHFIYVRETVAHFFLPCYYFRTYYIFEYICVIISICRNSEYTVIIGVVHLHLFAAGFKKLLGNIKCITVRMLRTQCTFSCKNFWF